MVFFSWETWPFIFNINTRLPKAFESIKLKSMRRIGYKYVLHFCAFLCYRFSGPRTVTQYSLHPVYFHDSTFNSARSSFRILCAKINPRHTVIVKETCGWHTSNTYKVFAESISGQGWWHWQGKRMPYLFFSELTNQIVGPRPRSHLYLCIYRYAYTYKLSTKHPAPNSKSDQTF